jgi:hypothetical protein
MMERLGCVIPGSRREIETTEVIEDVEGHSTNSYQDQNLIDNVRINCSVKRIEKTTLHYSYSSVLVVASKSALIGNVVPKVVKEWVLLLL